MKKLLISVAIVASSITSVKADDSKLWFNLGSTNFFVPFKSVAAVGLWDGVSKKGLAGAETPLIQWKRLQLVGGAVTTVEDDAAGTPFLGIHVAIQNPAENFIPLASFRPGLFGGYNFRSDMWLLGLKGSVGLF